MIMGLVGHNSLATSLGWQDDIANFGRALFLELSPEESLTLRRYYAWCCIRKMILLVPEDLYRYTRLFLLAVACSLVQYTGNRRWITQLKMVVNEEALDLANHSFELPIFQAGWLHPRTGVALHAIQRLAHRTLLMSNRCRHRLWGFRAVVRGGDNPLDGHCLRMALWMKVHRVHYYAKLLFASALLKVAELLGNETFESQLNLLVADLSHLVRSKLDGPRYELGMVFPLLAHHWCGWLMETARRVMAFWLDHAL